jgi:hypothetical protein
VSNLETRIHLETSTTRGATYANRMRRETPSDGFVRILDGLENDDSSKEVAQDFVVTPADATAQTPRQDAPETSPDPQADRSKPSPERQPDNASRPDATAEGPETEVAERATIGDKESPLPVQENHPADSIDDVEQLARDQFLSDPNDVVLDDYFRPVSVDAELESYDEQPAAVPQPHNEITPEDVDSTLAEALVAAHAQPRQRNDVAIDNGNVLVEEDDGGDEKPPPQGAPVLKGVAPGDAKLDDRTYGVPADQGTRRGIESG